MDRFRTALQFHKNQQKTREGAAVRSQGSRPPAVIPLGAPPAPLDPIVYTRTRSLNISHSLLREQRVMTAYDKGPFVDAFKILRTQVMHRLRDNAWNVIGVTSPDEGEGKTLTAVNLGVSLAMETTQTVLLVDANLMRPAVHEVFGLGDDCPGLTDYLLDDEPLDGLLLHPGIERFVFLPGGAPVSSSTELLTSPKMVNLVQEMRHRYRSRIVIFDLPPLLHQADVLAFSPYTDALLLVVEEGKTTAEEVKSAMSLLTKSHPLLGTVLNKAGQLAATPKSMRKMLEHEVEE
ncbi:MAG: CpsD/CapB family tyrosine-protein kinase [Nitrospirae bacterium]|nr:CpsD/CapB family tyrosine-protein kinase [Nitrospirota bacterium]